LTGRATTIKHLMVTMRDPITNRVIDFWTNIDNKQGTATIIK